jgi:ATP-dependent Clp protease ATP-binding subunit ClpC
MVIMTSNVGVKKLQILGLVLVLVLNLNWRKRSIKDGLLTDELKKQFPPEFLNRLDDVIIFKSLTKEQIGKIVDLEILN